MTAPTISVVGSINLDLVVTVNALPPPGATIRAIGHLRVPGGKGANQALAARRLGAEVTMVAAIGADQNASEALELLQHSGVDLTQVRTLDAPTGIALITVAEGGENVIVVVGGANDRLEAADVADLTGDAVICQLEVPTATVQAAAERTTGLFCLNAAPAGPIPAQLLARADVVVVNEVERDQLGSALRSRQGLTVVTLGAAGAVAYESGAEVGRAAPPAVTPVDTVGAGDAFVAAFTVAFVEGRSLTGALAFGCAAGAVATTVAGAQPSLPDREAVLSALGWPHSP